MLKMHLPLLWQSAVKLFLSGTLLCCASWSLAAPKALLVGIDGAQFERIQALNTPNFLSAAYPARLHGRHCRRVQPAIHL